MKKRIFIITGEESGDIRAAELVKELRSDDVEIFAVGGAHLRNMGVDIVFPFEKISALGFLEILKKLPMIIKFRTFLKKQILNLKPQIIILVDYPGFNIPFLKWLKKKGFKTVYYVLPKVWAHGSGRIRPIQRYSDLLLSIIPLESSLFGEKCFYVGNPVLKRVRAFKKVEHKKEYMGIFPGSRVQEIKQILPVMLETLKFFPNEHFILNVPRQMELEALELIKAQDIDIKFMVDNYYEALSRCKYAMIASGTATLEAALMKIPFAIIYRLNPLTFIIAKKIVKVKYVGLPNIFLNKQAFKEFIQDKARPAIIEAHIKKELNDNGLKKRVEDHGNELYRILGASNLKLGAEKILRLMEDNNV